MAVSDYLRAVPDQVARWVPRPFTVLGTDGFGRSGTRGALRRFFEVDAGHIVVAVLAALARAGEASADEVARGHRAATTSTPPPTTPGRPQVARAWTPPAPRSSTSSRRRWCCWRCWRGCAGAEVRRAEVAGAEVRRGGGAPEGANFWSWPSSSTSPRTLKPTR